MCKSDADGVKMTERTSSHTHPDQARAALADCLLIFAARGRALREERVQLTRPNVALSKGSTPDQADDTLSGEHEHGEDHTA